MLMPWSSSSLSHWMTAVTIVIRVVLWVMLSIDLLNDLTDQLIPAALKK
ncbi:MAG: hypothetical protein RJB58_1994 [Pseudomonadota bacterium]|jgi:hypothetical protein